MKAGTLEGLCEAAAKGMELDVKQILEAGIDVSDFDSKGLTPLMHAALNGHASVLNTLLEAGAPWNALDPSGRCAGDYALENEHQDAIEVLLNAGIRAELIFGAVERPCRKKGDAKNKVYLEERAEFSEGRLMDEESNAVMMEWENPLMAVHAKVVCSGGGDILNIGFGMGLVDTAIQSHDISSHTIIEAHPDVYARMLATGWGEIPNVRVIFGRWQDVLPQLGTYDGIFFDTFGEYYEDMREFHECLPRLLKKDGRYSFFNGMCGDNAFFHLVYCEIVKLELAALGIETEFIPIPVRHCLDEKIWKGVQHKYWQLDTYSVPFCYLSDEQNKDQTGNQ